MNVFSQIKNVVGALFGRIKAQASLPPVAPAAPKEEPVAVKASPVKKRKAPAKKKASE